MKALQQGIVQIARDARPLANALFETQVEFCCQLPHSKLIHSPKHQQEVSAAGTLAFSSSSFGRSQTMLNRSLGTGGQNGGFAPLYGIGGSRSIQLALKLQF